MGDDFAPNAIASNNVGDHHGRVCLANDSLLRQSEYIEELTTFAISYDGMVGNRLRQLRDVLAPPRPSNSRIIRLTIYDKNEPWQTVDYTSVKRGVLADFMRVRQRVAAKVDLQVPNRGLTVLLDGRIEGQARMAASPHQVAAGLDDARDGFGSRFAAGNQRHRVQHDLGCRQQPGPGTEAGHPQPGQHDGFLPAGGGVWQPATLKRQNAYESQLTAGALARAGQFTKEQVATAIGVERCIINAERYQQSTGTLKQEIIGSNVLLFTSIEADGPMDSSNLVRHVSNAAYGGGDYAVYVTDIGVKLIALTVENYEYLHVQHTSGIQQIAVN